MSGRVVLPALGRLATARLWLSYQRYGLLLIGGSAAVVAGAIAVTSPWLWLPLAAIALVPVRFGVAVLGRWPRKLRATRIAMSRIDAGRFAPASVRGHCGDPCFRVVAREILSRAGLSRAERRALIARLGDQLRRERDCVVLIDHVAGTVITVAGDGEVRTDVIATSHPERT